MYLRYAEQFLDPEQIDEVDLSMIPGVPGGRPGLRVTRSVTWLSEQTDDIWSGFVRAAFGDCVKLDCRSVNLRRTCVLRRLEAI